ncbi:Dynamin-3 [Orbilia brochopaga]|nr:Dynamin-3 [Drechslerella brochopaga]
MSLHTMLKPDPDGIFLPGSEPSYLEGPTSPLTPIARSLSTPLSHTPTLDMEPPQSAPIAPRPPGYGSAVLSLSASGESSRAAQSRSANFTAAAASSAARGAPFVADSQLSKEAVSNMGYGMLGEGMRDMVNTINQLRMKGVEDLGLPLPRIAVIGNQSAGKSSLIEAISGIRVPRYAGTCTRCPLEITLTEDPAPNALWRCRVSLRFHKNYHPKKRGDPWVDTQHQQFFFMNIDNPDHVEQALIRAQLAILNPTKPWAQFADKAFSLPSSETTDVPFSPNVICMEITGNNIPNLSFIDLPGIIHATERKEDEYLIKLVKSLVESYIKQEDCLILLAMTMKDDAVNQSAAQMARKLGPNRTIGALTKPDTVLDGEFEQWIKILRGSDHRLHHGYFVTKQPSQQQLLERISHSAARASEEEFFQTRDPWQTDLADLKDRFGTINLQRYLSKQLANLIRQRLPAIISSVQNQSNQVKTKLDTLPPPQARDLRVVLRRLLDDYFYTIRESVDARSDNNEFSYQWRKIANKLKSGLIGLRPRVSPDETVPRSPNSVYTQAARGGTSFTSNPFGTSFGSAASTPSKSRKRPASSDDPPDESSDPFNSHSPAGPARKKVAVERLVTPVRKVLSLEDDDIVETESIGDNTPDSVLSKPMHLHEVREVLDANVTTGIPGIVDQKAVDCLSKMHIRFWEGPVQTFINQMDGLLFAHVHTTLKRIFTRYENSPLVDEMKAIINTFHNMMMVEICDLIGECFRIEAECIYTQQEIEWNREFIYWKTDNLKRRQRAIADQTRLRQERAQERHNQQGKKGKVEVPEREGPDPFQREIDTMTTAQAYVSIARKRFGDTVMMRMMRCAFTKYTVLGTFREFVEQELKLRDLGEEEQERKCRELMAEDPAKEKLRSALIIERDLLEKAWQDLEPFQQMGL